MAVDDIYTVALLHMNGTDASTTFTDESGKTWTASGNAQIDTAQSKFGGASALFDGAGDFISTPDSDDWLFDAGSNSNAWTIDFWVRFNGDPSSNVGLISQTSSSTQFWAVILDSGTSLRFRLYNSGDVVNIVNSWNPAADTWYHIAIVKNGTTGYLMFVDGTQIGTTQTDTSTLLNITATLCIGKYTDASNNTWYLNGWMDEVRISKGIARWTANFSKPVNEYGNNGFWMFF